MVKCLIDDSEFKNGGGLSKHLIKKYDMTYKEYYHIYILKSEEVPKCKCGCGNGMKFKNGRYTEYSHGHYSRVHNNWGHNPKAIENSSISQFQTLEVL